MIRGGGSTTSLAMAHHQGRAIQEEEEVATTTSTSTTSRSTSTLMTSSKTLTLLVSSSDTNTTFTHSPKIKPIKRDTLTATSRPTERLWTGRGGSFSTGASVEDSLMMCLRTLRRCSPLTHTTPGLRADSRARGSSTAGQWPSAGGTWWPPSLTAPEMSRKWRSAEGSHLGHS